MRQIYKSCIEQNTIKKHVKPNIENKMLCNITSLDITKALNKVESERMRQMAYSIYNQAFKKAVEIEEILAVKNPMNGVDSINHEYDNGRTLERDEERLFLYESKKDKQMFPLFRFYLLSGARPSEPLLMKWTDIKADSFRIAGTKTALSDRELPMFPDLKKLFNNIPRIGEYIFPFQYATVRKHFDKIRLRLIRKDITLKDLRHTFGTRCIESGVSMKTLQKWMGHSTYETTSKIYTHISTEFEKEEISRFSGQIIKLKKDLI